MARNKLKTYQTSFFHAPNTLETFRNYRTIPFQCAFRTPTFAKSAGSGSWEDPYRGHGAPRGGVAHERQHVLVRRGQGARRAAQHLHYASCTTFCFSTGVHYTFIRTPSFGWWVIRSATLCLSKQEKGTLPRSVSGAPVFDVFDTSSAPVTDRAGVFEASSNAARLGF